MDLDGLWILEFWEATPLLPWVFSKSHDKDNSIERYGKGELKFGSMGDLHFKYFLLVGMLNKGSILL